MKRILYLLMVIMVGSCSPQQRLDNIVKRHPELVKTTETIKIDTVIRQSVRVDTVMDLLSWRDTVTRTVTHDNYILKLKRIHDTILVTAYSPPDTISIVKVVTSSEVKAQKTIWPWMKYVLWGVIVLAIVVIVKKVISNVLRFF